jgi:hypothetical protein
VSLSLEGGTGGRVTGDGVTTVLGVATIFGDVGCLVGGLVCGFCIGACVCPPVCIGACVIAGIIVGGFPYSSCESFPKYSPL